MKRRVFLAGVTASAGLGLLSKAAGAQSFPSRPITLVVGFAAGGPTDLFARIVARFMSESLGQPVVVENKGGAGGIVGAAQVARATPDGYTLLANVVSDIVNPVLDRNAREPLLRSFVPIARVGAAPNVLVLHPSVEAANVKELVALAKSKPDSISYASAGIGTVSHLSGVLLSKAAGVQLVHVPYRGTSAAQADLISGRISMMFDNLDNGLNNAEGGRVKAIAVTGPKRWHAAPQLPTIGEAGFPESEILSVFGMLAPIGTLAPIVERISGALQAALSDDTVRQSLLRISIEPSYLGPDEYARYLASETARWEKLVASGDLVVTP